MTSGKNDVSDLRRRGIFITLVAAAFAVLF